MTADVPWMTLSAVLLVEAVHVDEYGDHVEFHVDCLAMGAFGNCLPINVFDTSSDPAKIESLKSLWSIGSLLSVKDCWVEVSGVSLRLSCPNAEVFVGDETALRKDFEGFKADKISPERRPPSQRGNGVLGEIRKCVVLSTKHAGPMAVATIETSTGPLEAFLFPDIFKEHQSDILQLGTFEFFGTLDQPEDEPDSMPKLIVEDILRV